MQLSSKARMAAIVAIPLSLLAASPSLSAGPNSAGATTAPLKIAPSQTDPMVRVGSKLALGGKVRNQSKQAITIQDVTVLVHGDAAAGLPGGIVSKPLTVEAGGTSPQIELVVVEGLKRSTAPVRCEVLLFGGATESDRQLVGKWVFTVKIGQKGK